MSMIYQEVNLPDQAILEQRTMAMRLVILSSVEKGTGGEVRQQQLVEARRTLEIGCGKGAYGAWHRSQGGQGELVGVEPGAFQHRALRDNAYDRYTEVIGGTFSEDAVLHQLEGEFDAVVAIGTPVEPLWYIAQHMEQLPLSPGATVVLISDDPRIKAEDFPTFHHYKGDEILSPHILVQHLP